MSSLNSFGLQEVENLQFIDEFPIASEALSENTVKEATYYTRVIDYIEKEFASIRL